MAHPWDTNWRDIGELGKGGQGVARLVESIETPNLQGVLKYLKNNKAPANRARMHREVASLQLLSELNVRVPKVLDHNTESYKNPALELFLVMEFITGPTLKDFVQREGHLQVTQAAQFALSLCETIKIAHAEGVLHRDIKPDNIVVHDASNAVLYIVDYGLSFNESISDLTEVAESFKNKFVDLPEVNTPTGNRRDPRSDVTMVCAVFYFMLSGQAVGHLQDASGKLPHSRPGYSVREKIGSDQRVNQVELILSQGLNPSLQYRFQSIDELASRLENVITQSATANGIDPIVTAADLSMQLHARDRKTQLAEFGSIGRTLLQKFCKHVHTIGQKLGKFSASANQGELPGAPPLPNNLDAVVGSYYVGLEVAHHGRQRQRFYRIASRGEQCVVLACDFIPNRNMDKVGTVGPGGGFGGGGFGSNTRMIPKTAHWKEIAWFDESGATDVAPAELESEFNQWLDANLKDIAAEIFTG